MIGHRFGHQSGQDESSGHFLTIFVYNMCSFCVYLVFSKICKNTEYLVIYLFPPKHKFLKKGILFHKRRACFPND